MVSVIFKLEKYLRGKVARAYITVQNLLHVKVSIFNLSYRNLQWMPRCDFKFCSKFDVDEAVDKIVANEIVHF